MMPIERLKEAYDSKYGLYKDFIDILEKTIENLFIQQGALKAVEISSRVKKFDSIKKKCGSFKYNPAIPETLESISDLAGVRIVLLFKRNIEEACNLVRENFQVIKEETLKIGFPMISLDMGSCSF